MASSALLSSRPIPSCSASPSSSCRRIPPRVTAILHRHRHRHRLSSSSRIRTGGRWIRIPFALAESGSPKSTDADPNLRFLLQDIADSFDLPSDYFTKLPRDLRLDLNDAAFDLSNGPVIDECGQKLGQMLLNLSKSWEQADASTSFVISCKFPSLESLLTDNQKSAFGKRLVSAGRRFTSMGQYGKGELGRIASAMNKAGKILSAIPTTQTAVKPKTESRILKFGELQVELTSENAFAGAGIAFVFGVLSWGLAQGVQSIPETSLQYANDNALVLAKSLRGTLLSLGYFSTILSEVAAVALLLLGRQLISDGESKK